MTMTYFHRLGFLAIYRRWRQIGMMRRHAFWAAYHRVLP